MVDHRDHRLSREHLIAPETPPPEPAEPACGPERSRKVAVCRSFSPCHDSTFRDKHAVSTFQAFGSVSTIMDTRRVPINRLCVRRHLRGVNIPESASVDLVSAWRLRRSLCAWSSPSWYYLSARIDGSDPLSAPGRLLAHHRHSPQCTMPVSASTPSPSEGLSVEGEVVSGCSVGFVNAPSPRAPRHTTGPQSNTRVCVCPDHRPSRLIRRTGSLSLNSSASNHRAGYQPRSTSRRPIS